MSEGYCQARTKAGKPCKNRAQAGSVYCYAHRKEEETAVPPNFDDVVQGLNEVAAELQAEEPQFSPPQFSPLNLLKLIRENIDRFTPDVQLGILRELQDSLQGASPKDMLDPAMWKGLAYLLTYSLQNETAVWRERANKHLVKLPGGETLVSLQDMLEGSSPKDMLDPETWKGMWFLVNYSLRNQAEDVKRRILGEEAE
ncbi:MAG: hypothetical protein H6662_18000 [Ardenticatenaceae bacterium]|nr:hypothetical protein [Anaerolineales bacterium]MCB8923483.1 hypothetical protein [Ardenticatenaceae bacterium]MCB9003792.1 hypothetical protein [Ardenticatenaceae bacterium]